MSNTDIRVVPGPANYFSHPGSLAHLDNFFTPEQLSRAVWIYGERAIEGARPYLPQSFNATGAKHLLFKGHCSERDVTHLVNESGSETSVVIGVGGGAVMDTVKAVARCLGVPFVGIPTIAATCAAWTPLSVWYNDAGQALQFEIFDDANFLVLVEPQIILNAPAEYLLAGIGDTLAKWYEAAVLAPQPESLPLTVRLGLNGALAIRDVLLERSEEALADQQRGEQTQAFRDVVDAIIAGGGMVGGLGERYTRVAAAHAVHNGLTVLPQTENTCTAPRWPMAFWSRAPCSVRTTCWRSWWRRTGALTCQSRFASWTSIFTTATSWIRSLPTPCARWSRFTICR